MTPSSADVHTWLAELPALAELLPTAITHGPQPQGGTGGAPASRVPVRLDAIHLLDMRNTRPDRMEWADPDQHGLVPYLDGWVVDLAADLQEATLCEHPLPTPELPAICAWLLERIVLIAGLPQWPEFADGVRHMHHATRQAVAHLADPEPVTIHCRCGTAFERRSDHAWACPTCETTRTIQAVSLTEASNDLAWPKRTLQRWAADRGWPWAIRDGVRVYDRSTIVAAIATARLGLAAPPNTRGTTEAT